MIEIWCNVLRRRALAQADYHRNRLRCSDKIMPEVGQGCTGDQYVMLGFVYRARQVYQAALFGKRIVCQYNLPTRSLYLLDVFYCFLPLQNGSRLIGNVKSHIKKCGIVMSSKRQAILN